MRTDLSVIIPAYNEELRIGKTLAEIDDYLCRSGLRYEIVVVDDGSADGTVALVEDIAISRPAIRCVATNPNRGKGHAVRVGMLAARGSVRLMCDADNSMPPSEMPKLVNPVRLGRVDIAIGSRYADGATVDTKQPLWRRWWSRIANAIVRKTLVEGISDTQCGFKAFSAQAAVDLFRRAQIDGWAFDLEILALANRRGYSIREVAVHWADDERSRVNPLKDAIKVAREWIAIRSNLSRGVYGTLDPAASLSMPAA